MNSICRLVAGVLLAGMASATVADSSASATLTSVKLTLVDLDPSDGVTPWITFQASLNPYRGKASLSLYDVLVDQSLPTVTTALTSFSMHASSPDMQASGFFSADATGLGGTNSAQSTAAFGEYRIAVAQTLGAQNPFTISDKTLVFVTATSTLNAEVTESWSGYQEYQVEMADAENSISLWGPAAGGVGTGTQSSDARHEIRARSQVAWNPAIGQYDYSPALSSGSAVLSASFVNLSGAEMSGSLWVSSIASSLIPVPEPGSAWLMFMGLLGTGAALRYRRR